MRPIRVVLPLVIGVLLAVPVWWAAAQVTQPAPPQAVASSPPRPEVGYAIQHDLSAELRSIEPVVTTQATDIQDIPLGPLPHGTSASPTGSADVGRDPLIGPRDATVASVMPAPLQSFDGVNNRNGVLPPDSQGDVGPDHYVQWVNQSFAIWDKSGNLLYGPANGNTLWTGFGGPCESTNNGDPITLYDHLVDRWLMSQFALPFYPNGPFYQCIAISQTPDPTGAWYRYAFIASNTKMNDYSKFGVWPDGYYMSANQYTGGNSWAGAGVFAFDRVRMLAGQPASFVYFDLYPISSNFGGLLPSHLEGTRLPPVGEPNYFASIDDDAWGYSSDALHIWQFHVDWTNTANSSFSAPVSVPTAPFNSNLCNGERNCIPQPGTTQGLDAIGDRLMYRLSYRNFGDHQSLLANHTVNVGGNQAGIRWYEVRDPGGTPAIYQQGTHAPDTANRWMGSINMDGAGNIALGYSVSDASTYPSIRYAGRLASDPPGTLPQAENTLMEGSGSQLHTAARWGDYSTMSVDPVDDCTFWYTQEYLASTSTASWRTRIGAFKLPSCIDRHGVFAGTLSDAFARTTITGAQVQAVASPLEALSTMTVADGAYSLALSEGTYTVTVSAVGYLTNTISGVNISSGATTARGFSLVPEGAYTTTLPTVGRGLP